jgi:putative ABC transport system permease protein
MSFLKIAFKNLLRRRLRTSLTVCGVAMGIAAFVALVGFSKSFEQQWLNLYESAGTDIVVIRGTFLNTSIDEGIGEKLRALPEVSNAVPVVLNVMDLTPEINAVIYGWLATSFELDPLVILEGRRFREDEPEIMLGEVLAESLGKKLGDQVKIQGANFQVVGIYRGGAAFETGGALLPLRQMQRLSDLGTKVTAFNVRLKPPSAGESAQERVQKARHKIESMIPGLKAVPAGDMARDNQLVVLARSSAWGTSLIALLIGALGIANTIAMSVFERTRDIGVLRAVGWKRRRIMSLILLEATILGLVGGMLGLLAGWLALRGLASIRTTANIAPASIPLAHTAEALFIALLVGLAAGFVPAYRGARLSPVEALRHD